MQFSEEAMERFHKLFEHISEFPEIDPSRGIVVNEDDFISEKEKNEEQLLVQC